MVTITHNPTVTVQSVRVAQVVYNPQLATNSSSTNSDIVLGKSMSFEVMLTATNNANSTDSVIVQVVDANGNILSHSIHSVPVSAIGSAGLRIPAGAMTTYVPSNAGKIPININPVASSTNTTTTSLTGNTLNIVKTYTPSIGVIGFANCSGNANCYGSTTTSDVQSLIDEQTYISEIMPVADNSLKLTKIQSTFTGAPIGNQNSTLVQDMLGLQQKKILLGLNRIVAVVTPQYFTYQHYQNPDITGLNFGSASFVVQGFATSLPHELGHSFGIGADQYNNAGIYTGPLINGYDALNMVSVQNNISIMGSDIGTLTGVWMDPSTYSTIFQNFSAPAVDPQVIMVSGILTEAGSFQFSSEKILQQGYITLSEPNGDLVINALDMNDKIINSVSVLSNFTASVDYKAGTSGPSTVDLGAMPVAVSIAYDPNIRSFQALNAGKVLTTSSLNSGLLSGIINSIPEVAFRISVWDRLCGMTTSKERNILIEMASSIQKILNSKHPEQALVPLRLLIDTVKLFTYEDYIVADSTELTQAQVVAEIKDIIVSIEPKRH